MILFVCSVSKSERLVISLKNCLHTKLKNQLILKPDSKNNLSEVTYT